MSCLHIKECFKPRTPIVIQHWIIFTNHHHNQHRTHNETVKSFRGTEIGKYIDFKKMAFLCKPKPEIPVSNTIRNIEKECSVTITFRHDEVAELFNILDNVKLDHKVLHEKVYQAMLNNLMGRIHNG